MYINYIFNTKIEKIFYLISLKFFIKKLYIIKYIVKIIYIKI